MYGPILFEMTLMTWSRFVRQSSMRGSDAVVFSWTEVLGQSVISIPVFGEPSRDNSAAAGRAAAGGLRSEGFRNSKTI